MNPHERPCDLEQVRKRMEQFVRSGTRPRRTDVVRRMERRLAHEHAGELRDPSQVAIAFNQYHFLFAEEGAKERPSRDNRLFYAVAMSYFAHHYVRLRS